MAEDDEIPRGARMILKLAAENDWEIHRCTYARGTLPVGGTEWKQGAVVDSLVLGCVRGDLGVVCSWVDGSYSFGWVHSRTRRDIAHVNSNELKEVLKGELS